MRPEVHIEQKKLNIQDFKIPICCLNINKKNIYINQRLIVESQDQKIKFLIFFEGRDS